MPNDVLGEAIGFPMRHLGMVFDHFPHGSPMPFMLACTEPPCGTIRLRCQSSLH